MLMMLMILLKCLTPHERDFIQIYINLYIDPVCLFCGDCLWKLTVGGAQYLKAFLNVVFAVDQNKPKNTFMFVKCLGL